MNTTPTPKTTSIDVTAGAGAAAKKRTVHRRRILWGTVIVVATITGLTAAIYTTATAARHSAAQDAYVEVSAMHEKGVTDLADMQTMLQKEETAAARDYPHLVAIAGTLNDTTVDDPTVRTALARATAELADVAQLERDEKGTLTDEQIPSRAATSSPDAPSVPGAGTGKPETTEELERQIRWVNNWIALDVTALDAVHSRVVAIVEARAAAHVAADDALRSAAAKGATLTYPKAPTETRAVTMAAEALTPTSSSELFTLQEQADKATAYITAVRAASAAHNEVVAAEKAEAEAEARARQNQDNGSHSDGGAGGWSSRSGGSSGQSGSGSGSGGGHQGGSNGGGSHGGSNGGGSPGGNAGNGSGNTGGGSQSSWRPVQYEFTGSACGGGGQYVTYGSTLMIPGSNVDTYDIYEIPGYGWGVTWKCKYW